MKYRVTQPATTISYGDEVFLVTDDHVDIPDDSPALRVLIEAGIISAVEADATSEKEEAENETVEEPSAKRGKRK